MKKNRGNVKKIVIVDKFFDKLLLACGRIVRKV